MSYEDCKSVHTYVFYNMYIEPPSAPGGLTLSAQRSSIATVWSSPAQNGGRSDLYYQVEHSDPDNLGTYTGTDYISGRSTRRKVFSGLRAFTQYCIRVIAHNGVSDQDPDGTHLRTVEECTRTPEGRKSPDWLLEYSLTSMYMCYAASLGIIFPW